MKNKILVAGGAGFIGTNLCRKLIEKNYQVICLDNLLTSRRSNISSLIDNKNFTFIEHNIIESLDIEADIIINLASPASPIDYRNLSLETIMVNSLGTKNLAEIARKNKARFIQASTSEVYGNPEISIQNEEYWGRVNPIGPRSCYDEGKRFAEALLTIYKDNYRLDITIIRIFNTYGPIMRVTDGRVISNFISQALLNKDITIYGDGKQTRSFCYIDDLVNGILRILETDTSGEVINLGNPEEITINDLTKKIIEQTKSKSKIINLTLPVDDPERRCPDISKAKRLLNWKPRVSLEQGLDKTINYFRLDR